MDDYERIARVIRRLQASHAEQPNLASLADSAGLSPSHFHRLFTRWAGITPKDFLQFLTLAHAKRLLASGESVLSAALESGLSGPGRLHDLCVSLESASPGELKQGGPDGIVRAGFSQTPFGLCLLAENARGICHLSFLDHDQTADAWAELARDWPHATLVRDDPVAARWTSRIFEAGPKGRPETGIRLFVHGTPFQVQVWRALLEVPPGTLTTYGRLAERIGAPTACRAVGAAVGSNAISYLIPCHRVIRTGGAIGEYRWGSIRKRAMIAWESRSDPNSES